MTDFLVKIHDRFYHVDSKQQTFCRVNEDHHTNKPDTYRDLAGFLLTCRYWRSDLTYMQNVAANAIADGSVGESDNINVAMTGLRIIKEKEFLEAVAAGDEAKLGEIERDEALAAKFAAETGGHQIGSVVMTSEKPKFTDAEMSEFTSNIISVTW